MALSTTTTRFGRAKKRPHPVHVGVLGEILPMKKVSRISCRVMKNVDRCWILVMCSCHLVVVLGL